MVKEGLADIAFPEELNVFYNPVQEFNRDLSICAINTFSVFKSIPPDDPKACSRKRTKFVSPSTNQQIGKAGSVLLPEAISQLDLSQRSENSLIILEALAASGIRSVRYALEIPSCKTVIANDLQAKAVETIALNAKRNNVDKKVVTVEMDANILMVLLRQSTAIQPDVVDVDPYGSASIFLDSAVQCIAEGGMLCCTCTDMANLCGKFPESTFAKYNSVSAKTDFCHEMAIRILLFAIDSTANRYKRYVFPLLSVLKPKNHYHANPLLAYVVSVMVAHREKYASFSLSHAPIGNDRCDICGGIVNIAGPVWSGPLYNERFVNLCLENLKEQGSTLGTCKRIEGILNVIKEELIDSPFYYHLDHMMSLVKSPAPKMITILSAIHRLGHSVSFTHCKKNSFKTTAPRQLIWAVIREFYTQENKKQPILKMGTQKDLSHLPTVTVDFTPLKSLIPDSVKKNMVRFQMNPAPNWGPMKRSRVANVDNKILPK